MTEYTANIPQRSSDDPSRYQTDQTALGQAMGRARAAEEHANRLKVDALAADAKERAIQAEIARATELSVANNPQLQAQRSGFQTNRMVSSQQVGAIVSAETLAQMPVKFNGIPISGQQAKDMVETGNWSKADCQKAFNEAANLHGYAVPSFR